MSNEAWILPTASNIAEIRYLIENWTYEMIGRTINRSGSKARTKLELKIKPVIKPDCASHNLRD